MWIKKNSFISFCFDSSRPAEKCLCGLGRTSSVRLWQNSRTRVNNQPDVVLNHKNIFSFRNLKKMIHYRNMTMTDIDTCWLSRWRKASPSKKKKYRRNYNRIKIWFHVNNEKRNTFVIYYPTVTNPSRLCLGMEKKINGVRLARTLLKGLAFPANVSPRECCIQVNENAHFSSTFQGLWY